MLAWQLRNADQEIPSPISKPRPVPSPIPKILALVGVVYEAQEVMDIWLVLGVGVACDEAVVIEILSDVVIDVARTRLVAEAEPVVEDAMFRTENPVKTPGDEVSRGFGWVCSIFLTRSIQNGSTA